MFHNNYKSEVDMIHGPMAMKILMFALPLAASSFIPPKAKRSA